MADITGWFNWDALSAIGTVGALWFVVIQTTRAGRAERARLDGVLTVLLGLIEPIEVVSLYEETTDSDLKNMPGDELRQNLAIVQRAMTGLQNLPLADAYSAGVAEWTMALPFALEGIHEVLQKRSLDPASSVSSSLRYCGEASAHFRVRRDALRYGRLGQRIRRWKRGY